MRELFGRLWMLGWYLAALAIFVGLMWWFAKAHSHMWRLVAAQHAGRKQSPSNARKLESIVITRRGAMGGLYAGNAAYRVYPGVSMQIHDTGLALSLLPPLNVMCSPLFLPFEEMELMQTYWALWPEPFAIRMRQLPDVDIILGRDTVRWIREHVDTSPFSLGV